MNRDEMNKVIDWCWDRDRRAVEQLLCAQARDQIDQGRAVPAVIAALIQVARDLTQEHEVTLGLDPVEAFLKDIRRGDDGLATARRRRRRRP